MLRGTKSLCYLCQGLSTISSTISSSRIRCDQTVTLYRFVANRARIYESSGKIMHSERPDSEYSLDCSQSPIFCNIVEMEDFALQAAIKVVTFSGNEMWKLQINSVGFTKWLLSHIQWRMTDAYHTGAGARFSKVPVTLRARNQIFRLYTDSFIILSVNLLKPRALM